MAIYLVQHGNSLSKEQDPEKGISKNGVLETERIAEVAAGYSVAVKRIIHSGKKRALQTAEIFNRHLAPVEGIEKGDGLKALDDVTVWSQKLDPDLHLMLVGHLPFMEKLTGLLTTGRADITPFKFQNSGIVCLDRDSDSRKWFIKWSLMPNIGDE
jgi:phosphohistidine phosphatase